VPEINLRELYEIVQMLRVVGDGQRKSHKWCGHMMLCAKCGRSALDIYRKGTLQCACWKIKLPKGRPHV
jgi:hypothetical protein